MAEVPNSGRNLDPETLAAYVDGRLPPDERERVEAALASDPESYEWLVQTMRAEEHVDEMVPRVPGVPSVPRGQVLPFHRRRSVVAVAGSALAIAAALVLVVRLQPAWWQSIWGPAIDPRFEKLVAAVGEERYVEGRLTGGFKYGPLRSVTRGADDLSNQNLALLAAVGEVQKAAQSQPGAANLHAWGTARLLLRDYDGAIESLEEAARLDPTNGRVLSDLSAALLARAQNLDRADDLPRALATAERAIAANPSLIEAYFNRASVLEGLSLTRAAIDAWSDYLMRDSASQWRDEAAQRLERLRSLPAARDNQSRLLQNLGDLTTGAWRDSAAALVTLSPRGAREWIEDVALSEWGRALGEGDLAGEGAWLERVRVVSDALGQRSKDRSLGELVASIAPTSSAARRDLAAAHVDFGRARTLYQDFKMGEARPLFERVLTSGQHSRALSTYARINLATVWYYEDEFERAREAFLRLAPESGAKGFLSYEARCYWMLGIIDGAQGHYSSSLSRYQQAAAIYEELGELDYVATMRHLLADGLGSLGQPQEAWAFLRPALAHWEQDWNPRRQYGALMTASVLSRRSGLPEAVAGFLDTAVDVATSWGNATALFQTHIERARVMAQVGQTDRARSELTVARTLLDRIDDPKQRAALEGQLLRADSDVEGPLDPGRAVANLERAGRMYAASGSSLQMIEIELAAVRALRSLDRAADARTVALRGLDRIDEQRNAVSQQDQRVAFVDRVWDLYLEVIDLALDEGREDVAFELAERGRARATLDHAVSSTAPVSLPAVQAKLRPGEALAYFVVLPRVWVAWVVTANSSLVRRGDLEPLVKALATLNRAVRQADHAGFRSATATLSELLLRPLEDDLQGVTKLLLCPDGVLHQVPFAALSTRDGRSFVEHVTPNFVPAARVLLNGAGGREKGGVVSVFAPGVLDRNVPALPAAAEESNQIAELYGVPTRVGSAATRTEFLQALAVSSVVHFAGHAVINGQLPQLSKLLVTPESGRGVDAVTAAELEMASIRRGAVVVLAACSSAAPAIRRGEGALTLARPFLALGAKAVVATLWDVDDASVSEVFVDFHRGLRNGLEAAEALAQAQRAALRDPRRQDRFGWSAIVEIER